MPEKDVVHEKVNLFPRQTPDGRFLITDEMCSCGHPRSTHQDTAVAFGRGGCGICKCHIFWFKSAIGEKLSGRANQHVKRLHAQKQRQLVASC